MKEETIAEGWRGWDEYARFYDWENARTVGRRDVRFWRHLAARSEGPVLELGCGTGRILVPVARTRPNVVGIDRSEPMLQRARRRLRRAGLAHRARLIRGDIRLLPLRPARLFALVMAPYGILQSLVTDADLQDTLDSIVSILAPGGLFVIDLVPDLPHWAEYQRKVSLRGRRGAGGARLTLVESVRQDPLRGLTIFDEEYIEQRGGRQVVHRFSLTFRTLAVPEVGKRLERAGLRVEAVLGDYDGGPWDPRADVWIVFARQA